MSAEGRAMISLGADCRLVGKEGPQRDQQAGGRTSERSKAGERVY